MASRAAATTARRWAVADIGGRGFGGGYRRRLCRRGFNRGGYGGQNYGRRIMAEKLPVAQLSAQPYTGGHNWNRGSFGGGNWNRQGFAGQRRRPRPCSPIRAAAGAVASGRTSSAQANGGGGGGGGWRGGFRAQQQAAPRPRRKPQAAHRSNRAAAGAAADDGGGGGWHHGH